MISISDHPVSQMYKNYGADTWKDYDVHHFEAVTPKTLGNKHKLEFGRNGNRDFTETEMAVWYSHFELWCYSVINKESIVVVEHDGVLTKPLPSFDNLDKKFISYHEIDGEVRISPGSGYFISPRMGEKLVAQAVTRIIKMNSDGHLVQELQAKEDKYLDDFYYVEQIKIDNLTTIDHVKPDEQIFVR